MASSSPRTWIVVKRPTAAASRRKEIADMAGWEVRDANGEWRVRTRESYMRQPPGLLTARHIAADQFGFLATLPEQAAGMTAGADPMVLAALADLREQKTLPSLIAQFQLTFLRTPTTQLPEAMERFFITAAKELPASALLVLDLAPELSARYTVAKLLLTAEIAPDQLHGDGLPTGQALATSVMLGAQLFTAPALLALAPYAFGVQSARSHTAAAWLFGAPVAGLAWPSNHVLDAVRPGEDRFIGPRQRAAGATPAVTAEQCKDFFIWWTSQVNKVLAVATDPVNFPDPATGFYSPAYHWQYLASIEQLFRDVAESLAATESKETAQLRAAYDALDTLEGMRLGDFDTAVTPSNAVRTLQRLEQDLAPSIAAVALPACRRAVTALGEVKKGFLPTSNYYSATGLVGLPGKNGPMDKSWDAATSLYLRRDRNSAHSFLKLKDWEKALLFSHSGRLPRAVANLAFLNLLDLVAHPEQLATKLG